MIKQEIEIAARKQIGFYFEDIRRQRDISKGEVCRRASITRLQYNDVIAGEKNYTISTFLNIVKALDCYFFLADKEDEHLNAEHMKEQANPSKAMDFKKFKK